MMIFDNDGHDHMIVVVLLANGKLKANVAPIPSLLFWAQILPPCPSIMFFGDKQSQACTLE